MDATLQLAKIRGLVHKIQHMVANPNDNALYFGTGQYGTDSYELVGLIKELDEFLTENDIQFAPVWWIRSGVENYEIREGIVSNEE